MHIINYSLAPTLMAASFNSTESLAFAILPENLPTRILDACSSRFGHTMLLIVERPTFGGFPTSCSSSLKTKCKMGIDIADYLHGELPLLHRFSSVRTEVCTYHCG